MSEPGKNIINDTILSSAQSGDNKQTEALIRQYRNVVEAIAVKYINSPLEYDDIIQEGMIGLLAAIKTFNNSKGAQFKTYAQTCINNSIQTALRKFNRKKDIPIGSGCSLLLYKDARVDMRILDEVFGEMNWKRHHDVVNGNLFCTLSIWDNEKKEWVSKQDVVPESSTEKEKGQASDAFKRAGFNWGIGRELYTGPFIWIPLEKNEIYQSKTGSPALYTKFSVKEIGYNEQKEIILLVIVDNKNRVRFAYGNTKEKVYAPNVSASNASGKVYTGVDLDRAIKQMTGVKSREELERVWAEHPELHNNKEFRNITIDMQKTYPPRN